MRDERADLVFTDPPYNVAIDGNVCGSGLVRHREFAMAAGEMSKAAFTGFLRSSLGAMAAVCRDGAIAFVCMDWRHMGELTAAGEEVFSELKNLCVWNKTNGGMGAFYRSKHELVFVYKVGSEPHTNEEEAAHEQRIADIISSVIPDEKTRRRPGFDINRWRDNNPVFVEIRDRRAREAKARRSSAMRGPAQR